MSLEPQDPFREIEFPDSQIEPKNRLRYLKQASLSTYRFLSIISPVAGTLALILVGVGIFLGYPVYKNYGYTDPTQDGNVAPRSPGDVVALAEASTITVECAIKKDDVFFGSGWAIDLKPSAKKFKTSIITNHHVIEDCIDGGGTLEIVDADLKRFEAVIDIFDKKNDLAKLSSTIKLEPLDLAQFGPYPGYWVMTYGTADGWIGSVSFGAVMNTSDTEIFITANTSHGNSGGPLLDNEGKVLGTTSWGHTEEQYNGAMSLDAMCFKILKCEYNKGKYYWE